MQQPTDASDLLTAPSGTSVATDAMQSIFGMEPHAWQEQVICHIIALAKDNSCAPLLLIRPTGGGKLAMRDSVGIILAGVVLTIFPLLSLTADQADKVGAQASQEFGDVVSFHLDKMKPTME